MRHRAFSVLLALGLAFQIGSVQAEEIWRQDWDGQGQKGPSHLWVPQNRDREVADDFDLVASIEQVRVGGEQSMQNPNFKGLYVRFYTFGVDSAPGSLQAEYFLAAGDPNLEYNPPNASWFLATLPAPFEANGRHFVAVQPVMDSEWWWSTSSTDSPRGQAFYYRDLSAGESWHHGDSYPFFSDECDVNFTLYGTLLGAPRIDGLSDSTLARSGRLRIFGASFSNEQGSNYVTIDGIQAFVTQWTDTKIVAYVPEEAGLGPVPVQVATYAGASNTVDFDVTLRQRDGRVKWRFPLDSDYMTHRAAVGPDGTVYVNDVGGHLYAIAPDGGLEWIFDTGGQGGQGPTTVGLDGTIYVVGDPAGPDFNLFALDPDGTRRWVFSDCCSQGIIAGPNVGPDGKIYVVTDQGGSSVIALAPDGTLRWSVPGQPPVWEYGQIGSEIVFGPSVPGGEPDRLYVAFDRGGYDNRLYAFDLQGNQEFSVETGAQTDYFLQFQAQPAVGPDGTVYLSSFRSFGVGWVLEAFDPSDGSVMWQYQPFISNGMSMPDIGSDGMAYLVHSLGTLAAVNPDGAENWDFFDGTIMEGPIVSPRNSLILVGGQPDLGRPGFFRAFSPSSRPLWQVDLSHENGGYLVADTRAMFAPDGQTAYIGALILADSQEDTYSYLYALEIGPRSIQATPDHY